MPLREILVRFARSLAVMLAVAPFAAPVASAQTPAPITRAVAAWQKVKTARASFVQTLTNPLVGSSATSSGEFVQSRPDKLSIRFAQGGDRIVSDGRWVWVYLPSATPGQVVKRSAVDADDVPIDLTGQFLTAPERRYDIVAAGTDAVDGAPAHVFTLTPKRGQNAPFTRAKVWILDRDATIREFETVEASGVTRRVKLTSLELNAPVAAGTFTFQVPKGVRVVSDAR